LSVDDAIQYAPDAATSLSHATTGFFALSTAFDISSEATTPPPGEFISSIIALISGFLSAF